METVKMHLFSDMFVMLGRSLRHIFRSMDTIITVAVMPILAWVLKSSRTACLVKGSVANRLGAMAR